MFKMFRATIDTVIEDIQQKVNQLHALADRHTNKAAEHRAVVMEHAGLVQTEVANATRAQGIADKFAALIS